jgi:hypothetical protein
MEIDMTAVRALTPMSHPRPAVRPTGPPIRVRLPAGGWQVGFRAQPDGRTVVEVTDEDETLAGLMASGRLPILSIDAAWRGVTSDPGGRRQWWALAIGHAPAEAGLPSVTFTHGTGVTGHGPSTPQPPPVDGLWVAHDGLWVAAAAGRYTQVRLTARSATQVRRLRPVTARPAESVQLR